MCRGTGRATTRTRTRDTRRDATIGSSLHAEEVGPNPSVLTARSVPRAPVDVGEHCCHRCRDGAMRVRRSRSPLPPRPVRQIAHLLSGCHLTPRTVASRSASSLRRRVLDLGRAAFDHLTGHDDSDVGQRVASSIGWRHRLASSRPSVRSSACSVLAPPPVTRALPLVHQRGKRPLHRHTLSRPRGPAEPRTVLVCIRTTLSWS